MKKIIVFIAFIVLSSCKQTITNDNIQYLNGYWEIEKVELPSGEMKEYKVNETIDFFSVKNHKGFRQKVMPQLDGTYLTNDIKEILTISSQNGEFYVNYSTNYGKWKEEIIDLQDSILILKNKDNLEYHYKRQVPFSIK